MRAILAAALAASATALSVVNVTQVPANTCGSPQVSYSGFASADGDHTYYFWSFLSQNAPSTDPVVFWLTGGPGCSSSLALLQENGPCAIDGTTGAMKANPYAWNQKASVVWVDQPSGVGFSYSTSGDTDHNEAQVAADMVQFIQDFFKDPHFSHLASNPVYIFGESYGGHYAPSVALGVFNNNAALPAGDIKINLQGVGVGNGLTDPLIQYQYYPTLAYNYSIEKVGQPAVSLQTYELMEASVPQCTQLIAACQNDTSQCPTAQSFCNDNLLTPYMQSGLNPYDIRKVCAVAPLCYDMSAIVSWMNQASTSTALGVAGTPNAGQWQTCNFVVNEGFSKDWSKDQQQKLIPLLNAGLQVTIYAGDVDFVCNWLGNRAWTQTLPWAGQAGFVKAPVTKWAVAGVPAGEVQSYTQPNGGRLSFVRVYNAGHMVPMDQPAAALNLLNSVISGQVPGLD